MKIKLIILGSTGSIGKSTLQVVKKYSSKIEIICLSANKNIKLILEQSKKFKVKNLIIHNNKNYLKLKNKKLKKINIYNNIDQYIKKNKKVVDNVIIGISGFDGLEPTLKIIPYTKTISSANKESILCGWELINDKLKNFNTNFIPLDSEHFSIYNLIKLNEKISKIYLTASGGPFLYKSNSMIKNVKAKDAIKHPNWKMGKKISIDSATMMNKLFEIIEAIKIFNIPKKKFEIIVHPQSYIHAIVDFANGYSKFLAHDTNMQIPIFNSIFSKNNETFFNKTNLNLKVINKLSFLKPNISKYPFLKLFKKIKSKNSYFEIILLTINDYLVDLYLNNKIRYKQFQYILLNIINDPYFKKFYNKSPKKYHDLQNMINIVNSYLKRNL